MSNRKNQREPEGNAGHAATCRGEISVNPNPLRVLLESTAEDGKLNAEEAKDRRAQISVARILNVITGLGTLVGIVSVVALTFSIIQSRQALEMDQRAWLGVSHATPPILAANSTANIEVQFTNTGKTPALNLHERIKWRLISADAFDPVKELRNEKFIPTRGVLTPGGDGRLPGTLGPFTSQQISDIQAKQQVLYVFGEMTYKDVFKNDHFLRFCLTYQPDSKMFTAEHPYNDAD